jgi:hypothetical protein
MMVWLSENLWNLIAGGAVLLLAGVCVRNLLPGKHHVGCSGNCAGCSGCGHAGSCHGEQHKD